MGNGKSKKNNNAKGAFRIISTIGFKIAMIVLITLFLILLAKKCYSFGYGLFSDNAVDKSSSLKVVVEITEEMTDSELATLLYNKGLISDETGFKILLFIFTNSSYDVLPGTYELSPSLSMREIISEISGVVEKETDAPEHLGLYD